MGPAQFMELGDDDAEIVRARSKQTMLGKWTLMGVAPSQRVWHAFGYFQRWVASLAKTPDCAAFADTLGATFHANYMAVCKKRDPLEDFTDAQIIKFDRGSILLHVAYIRGIVLRLQGRPWWGEFSAELEQHFFSQNLPWHANELIRTMFPAMNPTTAGTLGPTTLEEALMMHASAAGRAMFNLVVDVNQARRARRQAERKAQREAQREPQREAQPEPQPKAEPEVQQDHEVQHEAPAQHVPFSVSVAVAAREAKRMRAAEAAEVDEWADTECPSP